MQASGKQWIAGVLLMSITAACLGTAIPSTSPETVSTIVAATMSAITAAATQASPAAPTMAIVPPIGSSEPPTLRPASPTLSLPVATRITFLKGATTGVVSAPIGARQTQEYVLRAAQAQPMLVSVMSPNQDVTLSMKTQGGTTMLNAAAGQSSWQGTLPQTEDYYLGVHAGASAQNFTLTVILPLRLRFPTGAESIKLSGSTVAGYSVSYSLFAVKDQKMSVSLANLSGKAALSIYGFADGQPYLRSASERTEFGFTLPATQDYIIEVVPRAGSRVDYILSVRIP